MEYVDLTLPERLLKATDVAEVLNISRAFAYKLINTGKLRSVVIGTARRVRLIDLERFIQESLEPPLEMSTG
jgi:excisionase family DNA binding protein